jgi:hypothetical protein
MFLKLHKRNGYGSESAKGTPVLVETTNIIRVTPINTGGSIILWIGDETLEVYESLDTIFNASGDELENLIQGEIGSVNRDG